MADAALPLVVLLVGVGGTVARYVLIEGETSASREMSRADAEAYARRRATERYGDDPDDERDPKRR